MENEESERAESVEPVKHERSSAHKLLFVVSTLLAGVVFGFALEKGRVFEPESIRLQMVFDRWIMMKMFLGAMGTGCICFGIMSLTPIRYVQRRFQSALDGTQSTLAEKNLLSIAIGTFVLGIGMTLAGACPGMVLPQVGAWASQAIFTFVGCLVGNLCYGLLHDRLYQTLFPSGKMIFPKPTLDSLFCELNKGVVSIPLGIVIVAVAVVLELLVPWTSDTSESVEMLLTTANSTNDNFWIFSQIAWPPTICGVLIGLLQIILVLVDGHSLGGSGSYNVFSSQIMVTKGLQEQFPYLAKKRCGLNNWWQVVYVVGGIVGGFLSAVLSRSLGTVAGVPVLWALIGGFLLLFGGRLAAGCTSGHGLSGAGLLFLCSFVAVPFMFAGAILTGFLLKFAGQLDQFCTNYCIVSSLT